MVAGKTDAPRRVVIEDVRPSVDGGGAPIKRVIGDRVVVRADLFADGHDKLAGRLLYRVVGASRWSEAPLLAAATERAPGREGVRSGEDDLWWASFVVDRLGLWEYTVAGWIDAWQTWTWSVARKLAAGQRLDLDLRDGAALLAAAAERAQDDARSSLRQLASRLRSAEPGDAAGAVAAALASETAALMRTHPDDTNATVHDPPLTVIVEVPRARFSSWYELFPRSRAVTPADAHAAPAHGTLRQAEDRLAYIADLGFDVVYLPPIHPIGRTNRKGPDNRLGAAPGDPGSPWAIGAAEGGHKAVHPQLGTLEDFRHFVVAARARGLEVALDIALQASPDHPYVRAHPEWFVHRADGTIQSAENPPKRYEDIYPFDFTGPAWRSLWDELRDVFLFWIEQGVTIFRVDNPHTKPIAFWRWCLSNVRTHDPRVVFLSEAFTRPKVMRALAKAGFSQSYTYFTWRTSKAELAGYVRDLVEMEDFFRPNFWPNTPDILPEHLQHGTRATFVARAVLAATLSPSWGIYGPVFELQEHVARQGSEEYARSEKYELRAWELEQPHTLAPVLRRLNQIRREHAALQRLSGTVFHQTDNDCLICYSRASEEADDVLLVVVNLDPHHRHGGWLSLDLAALGLATDARFQVHDLLSDARYLWRGGRVFVDLDPQVMPAHVFLLRRHVHSEATFEYYL